MNNPDSQSLPGPAHQFTTTHWSVVMDASQADSPNAHLALEHLCQTYWYPLYAYVRRQGRSVEDAQDLTQQFFARLLERKDLRLADPERGRFRSFLLTSLKHFLTDEWKKLRTEKRGGGQRVISWDGVDLEQRYSLEPKDELSPDRVYEKRWAGVLLHNVLGQLRQELEQAGRGAEFEQLKNFIWGDAPAGTYAEVAARLGVQVDTLKVTVFRLRKRFREQLRLEVLRTVSSPEEVNEELKHLRTLLSE